MDRRRPGPAQLLHDLAARGAAHDRVVDQHDALAGEDLAQRIELQLDTDIAQPRVRLDEGARDVAALDQALAVGDAARLGEADGGGRARVRERDDDVGVGGRLPGQFASHVATGLVERLPLQVRVWPREVDELEHAHRLARRWHQLHRDRVAPPEHDRLAWLDLANELGADRIERTGLRRDDRATVGQASEAEGADPEGVTNADQRVVRQEQEAIRALQPRQRAAQDGDDVVSARVRDQLGEDFGVARGPEAHAAILEVAAKHLGIGEVAVVGDSDRPELRVFNHDRLRVFEPVRAGGRVAGVTERTVPDQALERRLVKRLRHQPHVLVHPHHAPVAGRDARALLPAVLQRVEPEVGQVGDILAGRIDAE
jgi:hypothetical protein